VEILGHQASSGDVICLKRFTFDEMRIPSHRCFYCLDAKGATGEARERREHSGKSAFLECSFTAEHTEQVGQNSGFEQKIGKLAKARARKTEHVKRSRYVRSRTRFVRPLWDGLLRGDDLHP
jgi:hypothetical protein